MHGTARLLALFSLLLALAALGDPLGESLAERSMALAPGSAMPDSDRPLYPDEITERIVALSGSDRVELLVYGHSYEGHPLSAAILAKPSRLEDLESLRHAIRLDAYGEERPLVVWIGAAIHGNESSGAEAALRLIERFSSRPYDEVADVLDHCVLVIDPLMNPDGRRRFLADLNRWNGRMPSLDRQSLAHRSGWPSGRGNHYFMDLNRDWANLSQAETWGRVKLFLEFPPQVTFDLHEMGGQEGYLFSPPREPYHPDLPSSTKHWWDVISTDMARAFGREGWTCTTRDWHEEYNPNRGAAWPLHMGAVSFLGEQFNTQGAELRLPNGGSIDFEDAVNHQYLAALSLIESAAENREGILEDYSRNRKRNFDKVKGRPAAYIIALDEREEQGRRLARKLHWMGLELDVASEDFRLSEARDYYGLERGKRPFEAGSIILPLAQVQGAVARAQLEFDPGMSAEFLTRERASIENGEGSRIYETTAWSLAQAHGASVYAVDDLPSTESVAFEGGFEPGGEVHRADASYAFVLSADSPGFGKALAALHQRMISVWGAGLAFTHGGVHFPAGSVVVKREEFDGDLTSQLREIADFSGCALHGIDHALSDEGPDIGASSFQRLFPSRVAILAGSPFYQTSFGTLWHLFDQDLLSPVSLIKLSQLESIDLSRYNVIVMPDGGTGRGEGLAAQMGEYAYGRLLAWIDSGGTLITLGESSWFLLAGDEPITNLRARRQVLENLTPYLSTGRPGSMETVSMSPEEDDWLRRFSPQGAILRADLNPGHWMSGGVGDRVPVMVRSELALLGKSPGQVLGRFAPFDELRLSGLLWPEAGERLAGSSYLYREARGNGQMIAFLGNPVYRSAFLGTTRLFVNAVLLGPGMGARQPSPW